MGTTVLVDSATSAIWTLKGSSVCISKKSLESLDDVPAANVEHVAVDKPEVVEGSQPGGVNSVGPQADIISAIILH